MHIPRVPQTRTHEQSGHAAGPPPPSAALSIEDMRAQDERVHDGILVHGRRDQPGRS